MKRIKNTKPATRNMIVSIALVSIGLFMAMVVPSFADVKSETLAALRTHYMNVPTMQGEFLQFGPEGDQSGGTFAIKRPGKVRFDYEDPSPVEVVSNGLAVMVVNNKLKTFNTYPLKNTPLKLLLDDQFDISEDSIIEVTKDEDVTKVVLGDKQLFGNSVITLLFEPETFELRQWTIKDAQGKETSVMVFNVEDNVDLSNRLFQINKAQYKRSN
jgi:outer membrane lipoprotein-sorting protein